MNKNYFTVATFNRIRVYRASLLAGHQELMREIEEWRGRLKTLAAAGLIGLGAASCDKNYNEPVGPGQQSETPNNPSNDNDGGEEYVYDTWTDYNKQGGPNFPDYMPYNYNDHFERKSDDTAELTVRTKDGKYTFIVTYRKNERDIWVMYNWVVKDKDGNRINKSTEIEKIKNDYGLELIL